MTNNGQKNNLALVKTEIVDRVQSTVGKYVQSGELHLPADYSPGNALKSAFLILQEVIDRDKKPALEVCTKTSIQNALYNMVVQGLNPEKKQGYFIVYGKSLVWQRSYFGSMALAKRLDPSIGDIVAEVVYNGDALKYKIVKGRKQIVNHEQDFDPDRERAIVAAYCMVLDKNDEVMKTEFMTIGEIHQSWRQSRQNPFENNGSLKANSVHAKFAEDMCKRTVINKACKPIINSSNDSSILTKAIQSSAEDAAIAENDAEYEEAMEQAEVLDIEPDTAAEKETGGTSENIDTETGEIINTTGPDGEMSSAEADAALAAQEQQGEDRPPY